MRAISYAQNGHWHRTNRVLLLRKEGETIQFLSTSFETRGDLAEMIFTLPPGGVPPPAHVHLDQTETIEVLSGHMKLFINDDEREIGPGANATIPSGTAHRFGNARSGSPLVVRVSFGPARNIEWYFMQMACSAIRNGGLWKNVPRLEFATIHWALRKEYRLTGYPYWLQDLYFGSLMFLAKCTGAIKNIRPLSLYTAYVR